MNVEIERKYLVNGEFKSKAFKKLQIKQGYLSKDPKRNVRIRVTDNEGFITVKGKSDESGTTRFEWEHKITVEEANALLNLCLPAVISKTRYLVKQDNLIFEVDEFYGENEGLLLAEVELEHKNQKFEIPEWLGIEVTNDKRYYNSYLSEHPYKGWLY